MLFSSFISPSSSTPPLPSISTPYLSHRKQKRFPMDKKKINYNKIKQKVIHWNLTKQTMRRKRAQEKTQETDTCSTHESHENTKLEATIIYMQRTWCRPV